MKEIQILNNGDALYDIRRKINENFELVHEKATTEPLVSFGVNEGNETDGVADLIDITDNTLNFKVGGEYPNLVMTSGDGVTTKIESVNPLHLQNLADGEYKVVVDGSNSNITDAEFYSQLLEPENADFGDVWFNGESAWEKVSLPVSVTALQNTGNNLSHLTSIDSQYLAISNGNALYKSEDGGESWENMTVALDSGATFVGCVAFNEKFYLLTNNCKLYIVDANWNFEAAGAVTTMNTTTQKIRNINNTLVVLDQGNRVFMSTNAIDWTLATITNASYLRDIAYLGNKYYMFDNSGIIIETTDFSAWRIVTQTGTSINCANVYKDKILIGTMRGSVFVFEPNNNNSLREISTVKENATIDDIEVLSNSSVLIVGYYGLCAVSYDLQKFEQLIPGDNRLTSAHRQFIVGNNGQFYNISNTSEWTSYKYIPIGELTISGGVVTYFTTYPYNTNGLFEATSSTFGLLRTAAEPDELNCHCQEAVLTPANLYNLNNYRTMNTSYEVDQKVGCPYHHNLQLNCIQAGTTSNEGLNTKGLLEPGTTIEDGSVIWEVEELGSGGGGLEIGDIGIAPLGVDESQGKRRYLNGQVIIQEQYVSFTDKLKKAVELYPSLACTEDEWQTTTTMTVGGQVGKFVVDDEAGTIRLPKIIMPIQGLTDLSKLAEIVEAGLPDHRHYTTTSTNGGNKTPVDTTHSISRFANFDDGWGAYTLCNGSGEADVARTSTASTFNTIYGKSNTVQPEAIQYPYFIQVATGAETEDNIVNEIELNNPFSLLDYKYSEYELNNLSWLKSVGQYNSKAVYPAVYDLLLKIYNGTETKAGVSVKLATETFTDYDFVLNTAEETFRLPIKVKLASGKAVVGNGMTLGLTNGINNFGTSINNNLLAPFTGTYGTNIGTARSGSEANSTVSMGITTDPTKSGLELSDSDLYLYFYVGETVQNANLINAGRIEENFAGLVEVGGSIGMPSEKYIDLTLGADATIYTAPADGYYTLNMSSTGSQYMCMTNESNLLQSYMLAPAAGWRNSVWLPVKKGDKVNVGYNYPKANVHWFRFIYAEGSKWEAYQ